mgnify:CR=1 FL=1
MGILLLLVLNSPIVKKEILKLRKIKYKSLKEIIKRMNHKVLLIKVNGIIKQKIKIENANILLKKNRLIVFDDNIEKISVGIDWIANFYTNESNTSIKLEFDQNGEVLIHII